MESVTQKIRRAVISVYFMALGVLMYYFITQDVYIGGIGVTYKHIFSFAIIVSGVILFLASPNLSRAIVAVKAAIILSVPTLVMITSSLFIWVVETSEVRVMMRGISYYLVYGSNVSAVFAAAVFLYVFGEKGILYNLAAIVISNLAMIFTIILQCGVGPFVRELVVLIATFAGTTGDVIVRAEIHELAFCIGACMIYMVYMLPKNRKNPAYLVLFALALFCFVCALKRIAFVAIGAAVLIAFALKLLGDKKGYRAVSRTVTVCFVVVVILLTAYIAAIKGGLFETLESAGVDTNGRAKIYKSVESFYEFSPGFAGRGMAWLNHKLTGEVNIGVNAVHNDFLQFYIDLGFWGYILWLLSMTLLRTWYFGRGGKTACCIVTFITMLYMIIVSLTDNTMNYQLLHTTTAVIIMGCGFDERVREDELARFEHVSLENAERNAS